MIPSPQTRWLAISPHAVGASNCSSSTKLPGSGPDGLRPRTFSRDRGVHYTMLRLQISVVLAFRGGVEPPSQVGAVPAWRSTSFELPDHVWCLGVDLNH